jgi:PAS domain S-box-containing protein
MSACHSSLKRFVLGSLAVTTAVFGLSLLLERFAMGHRIDSMGEWLYHVRYVLASLAVILVGVLTIRQCLHGGESTEIQFRGLLEAAPEGLIIMNKDGKIILANTQAERMFGYDHQELFGQPADSLIRKQVRDISFDQVIGDYSLASSQELGAMPETLGCRKDGSAFPAEVNFSPLETRDGLLVIQSIRDVTERVAKERRRAARHAIRRILTEASTLELAAPDILQVVCQNLGWDCGALWVLDARTKELGCLDLWHSPAITLPALETACREYLAEPGVELTGRVWQSAKPVWITDIDRENDGPRSAAAIQEGLHGALGIPILFGTEFFGVLELYRRDLCQPDDQVLDTLAIVGNQLGHFIKRKRAEEAVHESEARKAAILESALDAIITIDHEGRIVEFNPAAEKMFGHPREDVLGREMAGLIIPLGLRERHRDLADYLATGEGPAVGKRLEMSAMRADGSEFPVELTVTRIRSEGPPMFTGFIRDITERKQAAEALQKTEEQFRQAQKMEAIGRLAGGVAHDFNNLLTVITGYSQLLSETLTYDDPEKGLVDEIGKAADRAAALTRQLLAFSRKQMLATKVLDLNTIVTDMQKMLQRLIGEDIKLVTALEPALAAVKVDPGQIEQVIMNLAVNARDAMPEGGTLTIETANTELDELYTAAYPELRPGSYVLLAISDTGCGMDETVKARLFEPFFTTKEVGKGTGLGLATVYGIIKQSGGHIAVYSEVGHGTTFKVYLPLAEGNVAAQSAATKPDELAPGTETVLLVEDEDRVRVLTRRLLEKNGYKVVEALNGVEALQYFDGNPEPVDLIISDVVMPEMSGPQLAQQIRLRQPDLKVLFLSGYTDSALIHNGVLNVEKNFLQKPFTPDALARKVREVLDTAHSLEQV